MVTTDPDVDAYFDNATDWPDEQRTLREILRRTPLVEAYKWKQPVYTHNNANLVTIWAFKDGCGLGFFKGGPLVAYRWSGETELTTEHFVSTDASART